MLWKRAQRSQWDGATNLPEDGDRHRSIVAAHTAAVVPSRRTRSPSQRVVCPSQGVRWRHWNREARAGSSPLDALVGRKGGLLGFPVRPWRCGRGVSSGPVRPVVHALRFGVSSPVGCGRLSSSLCPGPVWGCSSWSLRSWVGLGQGRVAEAPHPCALLSLCVRSIRRGGHRGWVRLTDGVQDEGEGGFGLARHRVLSPSHCPGLRLPVGGVWARVSSPVLKSQDGPSCFSAAPEGPLAGSRPTSRWGVRRPPSCVREDVSHGGVHTRAHACARVRGKHEAGPAGRALWLGRVPWLAWTRLAGVAGYRVCPGGSTVLVHPRASGLGAHLLR